MPNLNHPSLLACADASESGPIKADIRSLFYTCTPEFMPAVQQHLEEEDVARLTRHSDAQAAYQAAWETARRLQPVHLGGCRALPGQGILQGLVVLVS